MKTKTIFITLFLIYCSNVLSQSRKEILSELFQVANGTVMNKSYDIPKDQLWSVVFSVATSKYTEIRRESQSKGYLEVFGENDSYKESLTIEILGEKQPYRLSYIVNKQARNKNADGSYGNWYNAGAASGYYLFMLNWEVWTMINGPVVYPEELLVKVNIWNESQKKDKHKILPGRDF